MFSEPSQASTMELFVEIINGFHPLIIFIKGFNFMIFHRVLNTPLLNYLASPTSAFSSLNSQSQFSNTALDKDGFWSKHDAEMKKTKT